MLKLDQKMDRRGGGILTQLDWGVSFGVRAVQSGPGVGVELGIWHSLGTCGGRSARLAAWSVLTCASWACAWLPAPQSSPFSGPGR